MSAVNSQALHQLRDQLDQDMQRMYPELLTAVAPPTRADILDLMVKLDAITCTGRVVPEFAMQVISGLVAMIDVERLA